MVRLAFKPLSLHEIFLNLCVLQVSDLSRKTGKRNPSPGFRSRLLLPMYSRTSENRIEMSDYKISDGRRKFDSSFFFRKFLNKMNYKWNLNVKPYLTKLELTNSIFRIISLSILISAQPVSDSNNWVITLTKRTLLLGLGGCKYAKQALEIFWVLIITLIVIAIRGW